jgi:hypothetical protein
LQELEELLSVYKGASINPGREDEVLFNALKLSQTAGIILAYSRDAEVKKFYGWVDSMGNAANAIHIVAQKLISGILDPEKD